MLGPIESLTIAFPGNKFKGEILPELQALVDKRLIKIIDFVFVMKDSKGNFEAIEVENYDKKTAEFFCKLCVDPAKLISEEDILKVGEALDKNSSAAILLFEHLWFKKFRDAILDAKGLLVADERIPVTIIEEAFKLAKKAEGKRQKKLPSPKKK